MQRRTVDSLETDTKRIIANLKNLAQIVRRSRSGVAASQGLASMSAKGDNVEGTAGYRVIASAKRAPCIAFDSTAGKRAKMSSSAASSSQQQWASIFGRDGLFSWKKSLGHGETCLRAEYDKPFARELEARSTGKKSGPVKVACFDLDGCLIRPKQGRVRPEMC